MNTITYTLDPKSLVVRAYESENVARSMGNGVALFTNADELLSDTNVTSRLLVDAYNEISEKPVKKFSDNKTAAKRFMSAIADIHVSSTPFDKKTPQVEALPGMTPLGIKPKKVIMAPPSKTLGLYEPKVSKPRASFKGKWIKLLVSENPRKEGSHGHNSFNVILKHGADMPYEEYIRQGGRLNDLKWDIDRNWAEVYDA